MGAPDFRERLAELEVEHATLLAELRAFVERFPRQAALKRLLVRQGIGLSEDVRAPLRSLTAEEREKLDVWHASLGE